MTVIKFKDGAVELQDGETVLSGLLRNGHIVPYGCLAGVCQSCMMAADKAADVSAAQDGLTENQKRLNYFLSCQCVPVGDMAVFNPRSASSKVSGTVVDKTWLNKQVLRLRIQAAIEYIPGQYLNLWKDDKLSRSYSLASHPAHDNFLEFHIRCYEGGVFSSWLRHDVQVGDEIKLQQPMGTCFYGAEPQQPRVLACLGTGLAPVYGILQDALLRGHSGPITLIAGAATADGLYYGDELRQLAAQHRNVTVHFVVQSKDLNSHSSVVEADIYQYAKALLPDLNGSHIYVCGGSNFVLKMRKQCFLAGAAMNSISADTFLPARPVA